jgi:serine phosphatase RsbU (regulator of sigma subunit)
MFEEHRLVETLLAARGSNAMETLGSVLRDVNRFRGRSELPDDLSIVVVARETAVG